jgi:hypothetical protein
MVSDNIQRTVKTVRGFSISPEARGGVNRFSNALIAAGTANLVTAAVMETLQPSELEKTSCPTVPFSQDIGKMVFTTVLLARLFLHPPVINQLCRRGHFIPPREQIVEEEIMDTVGTYVFLYNLVTIYKFSHALAAIVYIIASYPFFALLGYFFGNSEAFQRASYQTYKHFFKDSTKLRNISTVWESLYNAENLAGVCASIAGFIINYSYNATHSTDEAPFTSAVVGIVAAIAAIMGLAATTSDKLWDIVYRLEQAFAVFFYALTYPVAIADCVSPNSFANPHEYEKHGSTFVIITALFAASYATLDFKTRIPPHRRAAPSISHAPIYEDDIGLDLNSEAEKTSTLCLANFRKMVTILWGITPIKAKEPRVSAPPLMELTPTIFDN